METTRDRDKIPGKLYRMSKRNILNTTPLVARIDVMRCPIFPMQKAHPDGGHHESFDVLLNMVIQDHYEENDRLTVQDNQIHVRYTAFWSTPDNHTTPHIPILRREGFDRLRQQCAHILKLWCQVCVDAPVITRVCLIDGVPE